MHCNRIAFLGTQRRGKNIYGECGKLGKLQIQLALDKDSNTKLFRNRDYSNGSYTGNKPDNTVSQPKQTH